MNGVSLHWFAQAVERRAAHRRHLGAFARSAWLGARGDAAHRGAVAAGRARLPQALRRLGRAVLRRRREPDRALDRGLARHRARVPPARRLRQEVRAGLRWIRRATTPRWACSPRPRRASHLDAAVRPADHVRDLQPLRPRATRRRRATSARRRGRRCATWCCRSSRPSVVGIGLFGFTLSWDEIARSSQAIGDHNTLPLELQGLTTTVTTPGDLCARHGDDGRVLRRHRAAPSPPSSHSAAARPATAPTPAKAWCNGRGPADVAPRVPRTCGAVASPCDEGIAFVVTRGREMRPRLGSAISNRGAYSTADPSRWTHRVGVPGRRCEDTPT